MVFIKVLFLIVLFLLFGAFLIISNENLKLNSKESFDHFLEEYHNWLNNQIDGSSKMIGYVVNNFR